MLSTMRGTVSGIFAKTLMMFLVVTFAVWGIGDVVRGGAAPNTLVTVGDKSITTQEFARELRTVQRNAGGAIPPEMLNSEGLRQQLLQRLIGLRLGEASAQDAGFAAGTDIVARLTRNNPIFRNKDGSFNAHAFESYLRETQQSDTNYRTQVGKDTLYSLYTSSVDLDRLTLPAPYVTLKSLTRDEKRNAKLITIPAQSATNADEAALKEYYEQSKDRYMDPEKRTLKYAVISKASIQKITKGDQSGAALEDLGYTVDDAIAAGDSMDKALKDAKLDADVKTITAESGAGKSNLESAVLEQGYILEEGETSGLLSDADGTYYMVNVTSVQSASPKPYSAVKDQVAKAYHAEKGAEVAREKANELKAALNGEDSIDAQVKLAQSKGANVRETGFMPRPDVTMSKDLPDTLVRAIFNADKGDVMGPVVLKSGEYGLAILSDVQVPANAEQANQAAQLVMTNDLAGEVYALWANDAVKRHPVKQMAAMPSAPVQE